MTKSENKPHDRTIEIINASIEAFAEHGYHNTTIQDIVNKAKFNSVGTIFRHFPRTKNSVKDDILKAIFEQKITPHRVRTAENFSRDYTIGED